MIRRAPALLAALIALTVAGCGEGERQTAELPKRFFGVAPQDATSAADLARMATGNVGSYHLLISWSQIETEPGVYSWSSYDDLLERLAVQGIEPLPYVYGTPRDYGDSAGVPPTTSKEALRAWDRFLDAAVARYGPDGEFWDDFAVAHPGVEPMPIRSWEIWNEVNSSTFWVPKPDPGEYANLLRRSERSIHKVDPRARIMVAGMFATPNSPGAIPSYEFLHKLFAQPGVSEAVDLVGVHPYAPDIEGVEEQMAGTNEELKSSGNGAKGLWVTEIGWGSDPDVKSDLTKTPAEQAKLLRQAYELLIDNRGAWNVRGALWYTWRDPANPVGLCNWCASAGLFDRDLDPKPSWRAYTELTGGSAGPG